MAAAWKPNTAQKLNSKPLDDNDLVMKYMFSQKSGNGFDLMQNCDLPPPIKVFPGSLDKAVISSMNNRKKRSAFSTAFPAAVVDDDEHKRSDFDFRSSDDEKLELLKALRLSQTRAREAETKYSAILKEKDSISFAVLDEAMRTFAYRQMLKLLEFQVNQLKAESEEKKWRWNALVNDEVAGGDDGGGGHGLTWIMALAFCLGIAGVGFAAFGCRYRWF